MEIRPYTESDERAVVDLWQRCGLIRPWNDPRRDIARKMRVQRELFVVGVVDSTIVATAMAGYEGHRGWINYLAVDPGRRREGLGRRLVDYVEERLAELGCPKINIQIRGDNQEAIAFYKRIGFKEDDVLSFGKRLERDDA